MKSNASLAMVIGAAWPFPFLSTCGNWAFGVGSWPKAAGQEPQFQIKDSKLHCVRSLCTEFALGSDALIVPYAWQEGDAE